MAQTLLAEARYLLAGGFVAGAGRDAYLAGLHSAPAYIVHRTQREPKTHSGARSEFSKLARDDGRIDPAFVTFLGRSYELKVWADYDDSQPVTQDEVRASFDQAEGMVTAIAALLL